MVKILQKEFTVTIINTSILTSHGKFVYTPCSLEYAKELVADGANSAVGHPATAQILSVLLGVEVKPNRVEFKQGLNDLALVFKLKARLPEGVVLNSIEEIEKIGYEFGLITRID
jgi:Domain of unknown function (DUF1874)